MIRVEIDKENYSIKAKGDTHQIMAECFACCQIMIADILKRSNCKEGFKKDVIRHFIEELEKEFLS